MTVDPDDSADLSRRGFLTSAAATLAALTAKWHLPLVPAADALLTGKRDRFAAGARNPNYQILRRVVGPIVRSESGKSIAWLEQDEHGDFHVMKQVPETAMERADAAELFAMSNWRSWRSPADLAARVAGGGKWNIRLNARDQFCLISRLAAEGPLRCQPIDADAFGSLAGRFTPEPDQAARFSAAEVRRIVPQLMTAWGLDPELPLYFEPVEPAHALKDLRLLQFRTSGWGPQVGHRYDARALRNLFGGMATAGTSASGPFIKVADGYVLLVDFGSGPGETRFPSPDAVTWSARCPRAGQAGHDSSCHCVPHDFRDARRTVLAHVFARRGQRGSYTYLGLGHAGGSYADVVYFRLEPSVERETFAKLGGYVGWALRFSDVATEGEPVRVASSEELCEQLRRFESTTDIGFTLGQWGGATLEVFASGNLATARYVGRDENEGSVVLWRVRAPSVPDEAHRVPEDEIADFPAPPQAILTRAEVVEIAKAFYRDDGRAPQGELWMPNSCG